MHDRRRGDATRVRDLLAEAELLQRQGDDERAADLYRQVVATAGDDEGEPEAVIFALLKLGDYYGERGNVPLAVQCYSDAEQRSAELDFAHGVLDCLQRRGSLLMAAGQWTDGVLVATRGRELAGRLGDESFESVFLGLLGQLERRLGHHEKSLEYAFEGLQKAQRLGALEEELTFLADMALVSLGTEDFEGARRQADAGLRRARETGRSERTPVFLGQLCHALRGQGKLAEARERAEEGLAVAADGNDRKEMATFHHDLALLSRDVGDGEGARTNALAAYRLFLEMGHQEGALTSLRCLSLVLGEAGDSEAAFKGFVDSLVLAASMEQRLFMTTFLDIGKLVRTHWQRNAFDDLLQGVAAVDEFFAGLERELDTAGGEFTHLAWLRLVLDCVRQAASSRGRTSSPEATMARSLAAQADAKMDVQMQALVAELYGDSGA